VCVITFKECGNGIVCSNETYRDVVIENEDMYVGKTTFLMFEGKVNLLGGHGLRRWQQFIDGGLRGASTAYEVNNDVTVTF
jgi:hypothetical protein